MKEDILEVKELVKHFETSPTVWELLFKSKSVVRAVDGVSFSIKKGQVFSLVGESGCGKTTIARIVMGLLPPTAGQVRFEGMNIFDVGKTNITNVRRKIQMVFQNPYASLNPRVTVEKIIGLPLHTFGLAKGVERQERVLEVLSQVGLTPPETFLSRFPHELSGGQRQRVGIARALTSKPSFVVADEPVAALDMSIRSQILNLMMELKNTLDITYLLISHDLAMVRYMSDWVAVIYLGHIVEEGDCEAIFQNPQHPYTASLLNAVITPNPAIHRNRVRLRGEIPSPMNPPPGCQFHTRCLYVQQMCREIVPALGGIGCGNHRVACHIKPFGGSEKA